jgi:hypothetical protein
MKDFILTCREKEKLLKPIQGKLYIVDTKMYSLADFVDIYQDKFVRFLRDIAELWIKHIMDCEVWREKGEGGEKRGKGRGGERRGGGEGRGEEGDKFVGF